MSKSSAQQELERRAQKSFSKDERAKEREQRFIQEGEWVHDECCEDQSSPRAEVSKGGTIEKEVASEKRLRGVTATGGSIKKRPRKLMADRAE